MQREMRFLLAFVDESGLPHPNDDTLCPVLAAICLSEKDMHTVIQHMYRIKRDIYKQTEIEVKATNMLRPKVLTFAERNKTCVERIVQEIIGSIPSLRVFSVVMTHPDGVPDWVGKSTRLPNSYRFLVQRLNGYAKLKNVRCLTAFDSQDDGNDQVLVGRIKHNLFGSVEGRLLTSMVETAFFVSSKVEEGIQIADLVAGIIRQHHEQRSIEPREYLDWVDELYRTVASRTMMVPGPFPGQMLQGIYKMPPKFFSTLST